MPLTSGGAQWTEPAGSLSRPSPVTLALIDGPGAGDLQFAANVAATYELIDVAANGVYVVAPFGSNPGKPRLTVVQLGANSFAYS